jgi:hypothetical protein
MNWTPEPWQHVWQHDTHHVARAKSGRMLGAVTLPLADYDRALACVNGCVGLDPAAVPEMLAIAKLAQSCWGFMAQDLSLGQDERAAAARAYNRATAVITQATGGDHPDTPTWTPAMEAIWNLPPAELTVLKRAWVRNAEPEGHPAPGHIQCPCGCAPESQFDPAQPPILCPCGTRYRWDGWILAEATHA